MTRLARILMIATTVAVLIGACIGPSSTPSRPSPTGPSPTSSSTPAIGGTGIAGRAAAGPVCPVETNPPDPSCAPRPVAGAVIVIRDAAGADRARTTTAADGTFFAALPAGAYVVEAQPAEGLMGTPSPMNVTVDAGETTSVELSYDTGIR
jgi:hypothetical protein